MWGRTKIERGENIKRVWITKIQKLAPEFYALELFINLKNSFNYEPELQVQGTTWSTV